MNENLRAQLFGFLVEELRKAISEGRVAVKQWAALKEVQITLKGLDEATVAAIAAAVV